MLLGARYQVLRILANGGFGQTYVAEDQHRPGNPQCVVKHLQPASANSRFLQNARRLFQTEAEILEKLGDHEQIPRLLAYFEENHEFYLVQEFILGHTLTAELQPGKHWSESQVYQLLQEVLGILVFVHDYGVIHRDIKPDNLIRRQHDNKLVLVDFGSVKQAWTQVVTAQGQTNFTFTNVIPATIAIGTPGYMPTEQGRGRPQPSSDIYALGMIAIQALTGTNPTQLIEESENGEIVWRNRAEVSEELASVLTKMVRYNFKKRYQTAAEALAALQQVKNSLPLPQLEETQISSEQRSLSVPTLSLPAESLPSRLYRQNLVILPNSANNPVSQPNSAATHPDRQITTATTVSATQTTVFLPLESQVTHPSQNVISEASKEELSIQTQQQESHAPVPVVHNQRHHWRIRAAITALLMSIGVIYTINWPPLIKTEKSLEQIATLKVKERSQECSNQAANTSLDGNTQAMLRNCQLANAKQLAAAQNFPAAIAEAGKIPHTDVSYPEAKHLITQWSNQILETATKHYHAGKLNEAIALAKAISQTSPIYRKAQGTIKLWQKEWERNNSSWQAAKSALKAGKWHEAINTAKRGTNHPYWQKQLATIIQQATAKLGASKTVGTSQAKRSVITRTNRHSPKQSTPTVAKSQVKVTPRRTASVTTKRPSRTVAKPRKQLVTRRVIRPTSRRLPSSVARRSTRVTNRRLPATGARRLTWSKRVQLTGSMARRSQLSPKQAPRTARKKYGQTAISPHRGKTLNF